MSYAGIMKFLRFCPMCGRELEYHPVNHHKACFIHGDFLVRTVGQAQIVEFVPMKQWRDEVAKR